jgi:hypothetical protein
MKQTSLKSIARHTAAVKSGKVEKTNIIGIRKAINAMEQGNWPAAMIDAQFELERAIAECRPVVVGALHDSGLKVLRNPRYAKRWTREQKLAIDSFDHFRLIRFDRIGHRGRYSVPVYAVFAKVPPVAGRDPFPEGVTYQAFAFRNIPWQTAHYDGLDDGPRVVPERGE